MDQSVEAGKTALHRTVGTVDTICCAGAFPIFGHFLNAGIDIRPFF